MQELRPRRGIGLDLRGPAHGQRVARAAEMRGNQLRVLVGRPAGPGPAGVIHVVGLGRAEHLEAAEAVERRDLLLRGGGNTVLREQLADRAVLALGRSPVVAPDVEDQGVLTVAEPVDLVDEAADLNIHVLGEAREYFHQAALERFLVFGDRIPRGKVGRPRGQLRALRNPAHLLGALVGALAVLVPAVVELALVLVGPLPSGPDGGRAMRRWPNT